MKIRRFAAHEPVDLTELNTGGLPVTNSDLARQVQSMEGHEIVDAGRSNVIERAACDFYFAQYLIQATANVDYEGDVTLKRAVEHLCQSQLLQAVISIASTIDLISHGGVGRTASLPHTIDNILNRLESGSADASSARELGTEIKSNLDIEKHPELRYVRHLRNKRAGHASLDLRFDSWARGDTAIKLGYLEAALVRIINAFQDFTELERMSEDLKQATQRPAEQLIIDDEGNEVFHMRVELSSVVVLCNVMREAMERQAKHLLDQLLAGGKVA